MTKLKVISVGSDEPYAFITMGHNNLDEHIAAVNDGWNPAYPDVPKILELPYDGVATKENTFHQYVVRKKKGLFRRKEYFLFNVHVLTKGAEPVTVTYWEEPYPPLSYKCPECGRFHETEDLCKDCAQDEVNN